MTSHSPLRLYGEPLLTLYPQDAPCVALSAYSLPITAGGGRAGVARSTTLHNTVIRCFYRLEWT